MNYSNDADGQALATLAASGMDMTAPTSIEFTIGVPDERMETPSLPKSRTTDTKRNCKSFLLRYTLGYEEPASELQRLLYS